MSSIGLLWFSEKEQALIEEIAKVYKVSIEEAAKAFKVMSDILKKED